MSAAYDLLDAVSKDEKEGTFCVLAAVDVHEAQIEAQLVLDAAAARIGDQSSNHRLSKVRLLELKIATDSTFMFQHSSVMQRVGVRRNAEIAMSWSLLDLRGYDLVRASIRDTTFET